MGTTFLIRRAAAVAAIGVLGWLAVGCSSSSDGATTPTRARPTPNAVTAPDAIPAAVSAGEAFSCGRTREGAALCWGRGSDGQLGTGTTTDARTPVPVAGLDTGVASVAAGSKHACAVLDDGTARCWGRGDSGALGDGRTASSATPVAVKDLTGAAEVASGDTHTCARTEAGAVWCWGRNASGSLGNGTSTPSPVPVQVQAIDAATDISAGTFHTCAVADGGSVSCWGSNTAAQLGDGTHTSSSTPVPVKGISDAVEVAAGSNFTCALTTGGAVSCWGANANGQLGNGTTSATSAPAAVKGLDQGVVGISAGNATACARLADGTARCWGSNAVGHVGNGSVSDAATPKDVVGLDHVASISAGAGSGGHACATTDDGAAHCWGANDAGQLGNREVVYRTTPVRGAASLDGPATVSAGNAGTCAVDGGSAARCWGSNSDGQLGTTKRGSSEAPTQVGNLASGVTAIDAGSALGFERCAVVDGKVWCWGTTRGSLGDGTTRSSAAPVAVSGLTDATSVAVGDSHACAIDAAKALSCWGANERGQLGDGTTETRTTPVPVGAITDPVEQVDAESGYTCARTSEGDVWCWGTSPGTSGNHPTPEKVAGVSNATWLSAGRYTTCAVVDGGEIRCWGSASANNLGNGATGGSTTPVPVRDTSTATQVAVGRLHACALLEDGSIRCWGANSTGQLGDGTTTQALAPVAVEGLDGRSTAIAAGSDHTCALSDAGLSCWGIANDGQLGAAPPTYEPTDVSGGQTFG